MARDDWRISSEHSWQPVKGDDWERRHVESWRQRWFRLTGVDPPEITDAGLERPDRLGHLLK
jgi:hypothetical protein